MKNSENKEIDNKLLPTINIDIEIVKKYHANPDDLVDLIKRQAGSLVFDMETSKGRSACRSHAANIIKCINPALTASKKIAEEAKKIIEADLAFRKSFEAGVREIEKNVRRPLTEWEAHQKFLADQEEAKRIEAERIEAERVEAERLEAQYQADHESAIAMNELFDLRSEKAKLEKALEDERLAREQAEREERLKQEAAQAERDRIEAAVRKAEENAMREAAQKEREAKEAIERAEREKQEAIEQAERDRIAAEARANAEVERAQREAEEKAATAVKSEQERARKQREYEEAEAERIREIEAKKAADKSHQAKVNNAILARLIALGLTDKVAKLVITAAARKELGALVINY